jgi:hypothetical protein
MTHTRQNEKPSMFLAKVTHMHNKNLIFMSTTFTWQLYTCTSRLHLMKIKSKCTSNLHKFSPFGNNFTTTPTIVSLSFHNISLLALNKEYQHQSVKMKNGFNDLPTCPKILEGWSGWIIHTIFLFRSNSNDKKFWGTILRNLFGQFQKQLPHFQSLTTSLLS